MLLQSYFLFPILNRKTIFWKKKIHISCVYYLLSQKIFVFNDGQITECEKQSSRGDESPMGFHCLKKHVLSTNFNFIFNRSLPIQKYLPDGKFS